MYSYNPETGSLLWAVRQKGKGKFGCEAGTVFKTGYRVVRLPDGKRCMAARLCWFMHYGKWPESQIDHINRVKTDNRIANLREATPSQNLANTFSSRNTSGYRGVSRTAEGRWRAFISINNRNKNLGAFETPEEAYAAYCTAALKQFGEYAFAR